MPVSHQGRGEEGRQREGTGPPCAPPTVLTARDLPVVDVLFHPRMFVSSFLSSEGRNTFSKNS